jgi:UDPglucose 6-dehydrogenase
VPALEVKDQSLGATEDLNQALTGAELVILGTEWREYKELDPELAASLVATKTVIDGRNVLDVSRWQQAGFRVLALGRNIENT